MSVLILRCPEPKCLTVYEADDEAGLQLANHLEKIHGYASEAADDKAIEVEEAAITAAAQAVATETTTDSRGLTQGDPRPGRARPKPETEAPVSPGGPGAPATTPTTKEASMATHKCDLCPKTFGTVQGVGRHRAHVHPGAGPLNTGKPCGYCKRETGHSDGCRRGKGTASNGRAPHPGGRAPKPAIARPASAENGAGLTLKGALAMIDERLIPLRQELADLEAARKVLAGLAG
jgi:hypothetical protein